MQEEVQEEAQPSEPAAEGEDTQAPPEKRVGPKPKSLRKPRVRETRRMARPRRQKRRRTRTATSPLMSLRLFLSHVCCPRPAHCPTCKFCPCS